jgi:hypothetical protein
MRLEAARASKFRSIQRGFQIRYRMQGSSTAIIDHRRASSPPPTQASSASRGRDRRRLAHAALADQADDDGADPLPTVEIVRSELRKNYPAGGGCADLN